MSANYDIVVIGGGIHGVGVAQAAAARGHSALVLEQNTLASGTSSRSTKLIHGGLRYLESFQISLVYECLRERELLLKIAPDLVRLVPFHIPVFEETGRPPWQIRIGLSLYAILTGLVPHGRFISLPKDQWQNLDGLTTHRLKAVYRYWDAQTDDVALTRAVMDSAISLGAELSLHSRCVNVELDKDSCVVDYERDGNVHSCHAKVVVNASGPWVNHVLDRFTPGLPQRAVDLVQGTHIIVDGRLDRGIYFMEAPQDHRAIFALPWKDKLMVGTTEHTYHGDPAAVVPLKEEKEYLLAGLAHYFPAYAKLTAKDIIESFAGLRVLPEGDSDAFSRPRGTVLLTDRPERPRALSIYGGKLTAYRAETDKVLRYLSPSLPKRKPVADTRKLTLKL